jgi:hypothetical protein
LRGTYWISANQYLSVSRPRFSGHRHALLYQYGVSNVF